MKFMTSPLVDIVIPAWNRCDMTFQCLEHLYALDAGAPFRVILVDNGSKDRTRSILRWYKANTKPWVPWARRKGFDLKTLHLRHNLGFARANNLGAERGNARWLLFMNNDAFPANQGWLRLLLLQARACSWDAIGPVSDNVLGIQDQKWNRSFPSAHEAKFLSGFCLLVSRNAFESVGGWDDEFLNGDEDLDLCIRLRKSGFTLGVNREVFVRHICSQTMHNFVAAYKMTIQEWFANTRDQLLRKHGAAWHEDLFQWEQYNRPPEEWRAIGVLPNGRFFQLPGSRRAQVSAIRGLYPRKRQSGTGVPDAGLYSRYSLDTGPGNAFVCRCGGPCAGTGTRAVACAGA